MVVPGGAQERTSRADRLEAARLLILHALPDLQQPGCCLLRSQGASLKSL